MERAPPGSRRERPGGESHDHAAARGDANAAHRGRRCDRVGGWVGQRASLPSGLRVPGSDRAGTRQAKLSPRNPIRASSATVIVSRELGGCRRRCPVVVAPHGRARRRGLLRVRHHVGVPALRGADPHSFGSAARRVRRRRKRSSFYAPMSRPTRSFSTSQPTDMATARGPRARAQDGIVFGAARHPRRARLTSLSCRCPTRARMPSSAQTPLGTSV